MGYKFTNKTSLTEQEAKNHEKIQTILGGIATL